MLTNEQARERVINGAAHLDVVRPGWWKRIDVGTLTLHDACGCIVGQLSGDIRFRMSAVGLLSGLECRAAGIRPSHAVMYGFDLASQELAWDGDGGMTRRQLYQPLQDAWIEAIADRRLRESVTSVDAVDPVERIVAG